MSDTENKPGNKPGNKQPARKPMSLGGPRGGGNVRQGFSQGRTVVVEKKKRRLVNAPGAPGVPAQPGALGVAVPPAPENKTDYDAAAAKRLGLSKEEYIKRQKAVGKAKAEKEVRDQARADERKALAERDDADRAALSARKEADALAATEATRIAKEQKAAAEAERRAARPIAGGPIRKPKQTPAPQNDTPAADPAAPIPDASALERAGGRIKKAKPQHQKPNRSRKNEPTRRRGKLTIVSALAGDEERQRSLASVKRAREREKQRRTGGGTHDKNKVYREVVVPETITVADLANRMSERTHAVIKYLMQQGDMSKADDVLDADTAQLIVEDFGHTVKRVAESDAEAEAFTPSDDADDEADMKPRPPVIAIMGHVDHGKTTLLDALRATDVASGEAGGITQHIGAYQLKLKSGETITVLDTPGHAAFSAMRTRGAAAVDIVVLVVAADDGVMPQTIESIKYAKAAGTPIIVAINKMDAPEANPKKIEEDLLRHEIITESMSGDVQTVQVSALKKTGLDALAEAIVMQAELMDLKANPKRRADGLVIESKVAKGRGPVATFLIKRGTLKRGDIVVAGEHWGKVKAIMNERDARLKQAGPSEPVEVLGMDGAPAPGEAFAVVRKESKAREITEYRQRRRKQANAAGPIDAATSMEQMLEKLKDKSVDEMTILVKADVQGSVEAIRSSVEALGNEDVRARVIHGAAGGINESDVMLAKSAGAPIIAFNVRANRQAKDLAEREGVEIRYYSIIYELLDDVKGVLEGMLAPERKETFIGYAEILQVFDISKLGNIAGCKITEGKVERGAGVRLLRDDVVIHEGELSTLKRFKEEVKKVVAGQECGMGFENYHDLRKGDVIECFTVEMLDRKLD
ncbi:MAG: translation initiation factor IF-2 [Robiginitomaculum sp.]|nr:MAG: translation initiation factor IF-2 [Robiginitomaculum sp.]